MAGPSGYNSEQLNIFKKILEDTVLESSPCKVCNNNVFWGFEFCMFCGAINEHYDPDYDQFEDPGDNCETHHKELKDWKEAGFCSRCGCKI